MKLYRYVKALENQNGNFITSPKLINSLTNSKIFFSQPASFNDPLECIIPISLDNYEIHKDSYKTFVQKILNERLKNSSPIRKKSIDEAINFGIRLENCIIVCFSKKENNALMWSHYADQYRGICLCYEFPDNEKDFKNEIIWSTDILNLFNLGMELHMEDVVYSQKRPSLQIKDTTAPIDQWKIQNDYNIKDAIFVKPQYWSYEEEWRIALVLPFGCDSGFSAGINTSSYYMEIPKKWLKQITFGFRLDEKYRKDIHEALKNSNYNDVAIKNIRLSHDTFNLSTY